MFSSSLFTIPTQTIKTHVIHVQFTVPIFTMSYMTQFTIGSYNQYHTWMAWEIFTLQRESSEPLTQQCSSINLSMRPRTPKKLFLMKWDLGGGSLPNYLSPIYVLRFGCPDCSDRSQRMQC